MRRGQAEGTFSERGVGGAGKMTVVAPVRADLGYGNKAGVLTSLREGFSHYHFFSIKMCAFY
jgi:hypothetical protein